MAVGHRIPTRAGHLHQADVVDQPTIRNTTDDPAIRRPRRFKLWAILITTLIVTLSIIIIWTTVVVPWWHGVQHHWQYGSSPITQMHAHVAHGRPAPFTPVYHPPATSPQRSPFSPPDDPH